jgi:hypothetical protein
MCGRGVPPVRVPTWVYSDFPKLTVPARMGGEAAVQQKTSDKYDASQVSDNKVTVHTSGFNKNHHRRLMR